jgi:hypothetical protein
MQRRIKHILVLAIILTLGVTSLSHAVPLPPSSLIEISATSSDENSPAVAYSTEGRTYLVAYEKDDHVQMRMYDALGDPVSQYLIDFGEGTFWPAIAYNNLHNLYGLTYVSDFTSYSSIVMCWISGSTQSVITCDEIYQGVPGIVLISPSIAFNNNDDNDDFLIVWQEGNLSDYSIYGHRAYPTDPYTEVGSLIEIARTTLTPTYDEIFSSPDVTYNLNMNEYFVVFDYWTDDPSHTTESDILARRIRNDGTGPAPLPYLQIDTTECNQSRPTVAAYRLNQITPYFVAYQDDWNTPGCDTETSIRGIYLEKDGTLPDPASYINVSATYQVREAHPDITASEALGAYTITWSKNSGTNMDIYLRHIDPSTGLTDLPQLISGAEANARGNEDFPVVAGGAPTTFVAWHEDGWGGGFGDVIGWIDTNLIFLPLILK